MLKKTATPPFEASIAAKYVTGRKDRNLTVPTSIFGSFSYSSFRQTDEWDDSGTQQEVTTVAEDHRDPENPDHSTSPVCCRVMSSYGQVWNPWRVRGGIVTIFFLSFFVSPNVSSHYAVSSFVGLIHASSIVSPYVLPFVLYIVSYIVSTIYVYEHVVYIVDRELYCSLASL